jgi:hypothetical protein
LSCPPRAATKRMERSSSASVSVDGTLSSMVSSVGPQTASIGREERGGGGSLPPPIATNGMDHRAGTYLGGPLAWTMGQARKAPSAAACSLEPSARNHNNGSTLWGDDTALCVEDRQLRQRPSSADGMRDTEGGGTCLPRARHCRRRRAERRLRTTVKPSASRGGGLGSR